MNRFRPSMHSPGYSARKNTDYSYPGYTDGKMVRGFLHNLEQDARLMQQVVSDDDTLPPWVTWKVYTAEDRLQAATRYMARQAKLVKAKANVGEEEGGIDAKHMLIAGLVLVGLGYWQRKRMQAARE